MTAATSDMLNAEAFARLYPEQYYAKFISQSVRPDGRPLGRSRPTSVGLGAVSTADSSALVKIGSATALAGIKCEMFQPPDDAPDQGRLAVAVELAPLCSATTRPGRLSELAQVLTEQLGALLGLEGLLDLRQLCIDPGRAAWVAYLDIYVLDADGSLHDACLLAALAALSSLRLPRAVVDEAGNVVRPAAGGAEGVDGQLEAAGGQQGAEDGEGQGRRLALGALPVSLTCGLYGDRTIVDLTAEEEALVDAVVVTTVDGSGDVLGMLKPGGAASMSMDRLQDCIEAARQRHTEVEAILRQALEAAGAAFDAPA